jgi:HK97 family phage portal protein
VAEVTLLKAIRNATTKAQSLSGVDGRNGFWQTIFDTFPGAWQQNVEVDQVKVMAYWAVFACVTLIANDIGKLRQKLVEEDKGIWAEVTSPAFSPVLRKPNHYQNHIQFKENWITSKLMRGNTYALKSRDARGVVRALYILDPDRVTPLIADDGSVYYQLANDNLSGLDEMVTVPASEIIHDRINCLYHPLVGLSPIYAAGLAATQGLAMQNNSARLFTNMSRPSGILIAPGPISKDTAEILKTKWEENFTGDNFGKTAVLGDGMKYERLSMTSAEAEMLSQLDWTAKTVCSTFHVPAFKIGVGSMPTYQNGEVLNQVYYSDCLQSHIEQYELCMDEGLGLAEPVGGRMMGVELEIEGLLRMDQATQVKTLAEAVKGSIMTPNTALKKQNLPPVEGGDTIYMQQQNYSLGALHERDESDDPFNRTKPPAPTPPSPEDVEEQAKILAYYIQKHFDEEIQAAS